MEAAIDKPDSDWESILKQMISNARQRSNQQKLTSIMKPARSGLDCIMIPNESWYYSVNTNALFSFKEGLFLAHPQQDDVGYCFNTVRLQSGNRSTDK